MHVALFPDKSCFQSNTLHFTLSNDPLAVMSRKYFSKYAYSVNVILNFKWTGQPKWIKYRWAVAESSGQNDRINQKRVTEHDAQIKWSNGIDVFFLRNKTNEQKRNKNISEHKTSYSKTSFFWTKIFYSRLNRPVYDVVAIYDTRPGSLDFNFLRPGELWYSGFMDLSAPRHW